MPLFFFIAGYFMYSDNYSLELLKKRGTNRLVKQLYPTLLLGFIFCMTFNLPIYPESVFDPFKRGYWFTYVSVEMFFLVVPPLVILSERGVARVWKALYLFAICIFIEIIHYTDALSHDVSGFLSFVQIGDYLPYLIFGMAAKMYAGQFEKISSSVYWLISCLALFFIINKYGDIYPPMSVAGVTRDIILAFTGIIIINILFFYIYKSKFLRSTFVMNGLAFIGTWTLEIYLLHYFCLFFLKEFFIIPQLGDMLRAISNTVYELPVCILLSTLVAVICLGIVHFFKIIKIHRFIFPSALPRLHKIHTGNILPPKYS